MIHPLLDAIKPALKKNGHSNKDIATRLGISTVQISYLLNGHCQVSILQLEELCKLAGYELIIKLL